MKAAAKSSAGISVRPASPEDAGRIRSLAQRIWPVCFSGILTPDQIANMLETIYAVESLKRQMQEGQRFWIGYSDEHAVGYASAYRQGDSIWLKKLYCDPDFQGRGIGTSMLESAVATFQPASDVRLLVNRENIAAQEYYERLGFKCIGEEPVMMGDFPFIDYLYSKTLTEK